MKKLFYVVIFTALILTIFDGRKTENESLKHAIEQFSKTLIAESQISIEPETYVQIVTDTIVGNNFKARVQNYAMMRGKDLVESKLKDHFRRKFESRISLSYNQNDIFQYTINSDSFTLRDDSKFWDNATFEHAWVCQHLSTDDHLVLRFSFLDPKSDNFKLYEMEVDKHGNHIIKLLEEKLS